MGPVLPRFADVLLYFGTFIPSPGGGRSCARLPSKLLAATKACADAIFSWAVYVFSSGSACVRFYQFGWLAGRCKDATESAVQPDA